MRLKARLYLAFNFKIFFEFLYMNKVANTTLFSAENHFIKATKLYLVLLLKEIKISYTLKKEVMNLIHNFFYGGDKEIRTLDPLRARQVLSQLSYTPINGGPSGTRTPDLPVMSRLL